MPITGAVGVIGCKLTTALAAAREIHPPLLVTVKLYVPPVNPVTTVLVPLPVTDPGLIVQVPEGRPLNATLPMVVQVGWVIVPTTGVAGVEISCVIDMLVVEVQPLAPVTVTV